MSYESLTDSRLAALYDTDNPDGPDHDYFRRCADLGDARTVVDLGCGTGILTVTLAAEGRTVIGIDPDAGMLAVARQRAGHERVEWRLGDSRQIGTPSADLVLMTGNVVQHIGPDDWLRMPRDVAAGLHAPADVSDARSDHPRSCRGRPHCDRSRWRLVRRAIRSNFASYGHRR